MSTSSTPVLDRPAAPRVGEPVPSAAERVRVWDPFVRLFHWSLVSGFLVAYFTEDDFLSLHTWAGYAVLALICVRLVWGLIGPRYARWSDFVRGPRATLAYLSDAVHARAERHLGHNPAGGAMIVALLICVAATSVSGVALLGSEEMAGPLAGLLQGLPRAAGHWLKEAHEVLANLTVLLVVAHVAGVALGSLQHRENLVKSMFTGYKRGPEQ